MHWMVASILLMVRKTNHYQLQAWLCWAPLAAAVTELRLHDAGAAVGESMLMTAGPR
jgi:hypothetical protein